MNESMNRKSAVEDNTIEVRLEGGDLVIGNLAHGHAMYDSSVMLTQEQVAEILPRLQHYAETGELPQ